MTKAGPQTLTLSGDSDIDGPIHVVGGILSFVSPEALGSTTAPIHLDGGSIEYSGTASAVLSRSIVLGETGGTVSNGSDATLTLAGEINGAGNVTFGGIGSLSITGVNTYTGATTIGMSALNLLRFTSDAAFGAGGAIFFTAGILVPTFNWTTDRAIHPSSNASISSGAFEVMFNGPVLGRGSLLKQGEGSLTLHDADEFLGRRRGERRHGDHQWITVGWRACIRGRLGNRQLRVRSHGK